MIVHEASQKIVLHLPDNARVTTVIPTAREFLYQGQNLVAVPHKLAETRVLRNLGFDVPSPIRHHYAWRGQYTPFRAQLDTSEFLTLNPRAFVLNDMGCVDAETEYLSPTGWRRMDSYIGGPAAQYWPETGEVEFVDAKYVKLPCSDMFRIKTKYGIDQVLSPEHRVLLETRGDGRREVVQAAELFERQQAWAAGTQRKSRSAIGWVKAAVPVTFRAPGGIGLALSDADIRLQVACIADGYFSGRRTSNHRCTIRLKKLRKIERLRTMLADTGRHYNERPVKPEGFVAFTFDAPERSKVFGPHWWGATVEQLKIVADEVMHWDGSVSASKPGARFSTLERASADFVQFVFAGTGRTARVLELPRRGTIEYNVQVRDDGKPLQLASLSSDGTRQTTMSPTVSPDGYKYCFMVPSTFLLFRRNGCIFASGNTGKTLAALWAYDYLRSQGLARKLLVVSPLSTLERTWADEVFNHFPHLTTAVLHGTADRRRKLIKNGADIFLINHDGLSVVLEDLVAKDDIDCVIVDEIASFRTANTRRWKALNKVCTGRQWVWGMTGTPTPNAPTDAWAQCRLICPSRVPKYFGQFRDSVQVKKGQFNWVNRPNATEVVADAMQPAIRFRRDECVDLPPAVYQTREVPLSDEQKQAYKEMMSKLTMEFEGEEALAVNEAVKMQKLVQIACGVVYAGDGKEIVLPNTGRINETREIIEQAGGKVIVFVPFKAVLRKVAAELGKEFRVGTISGETSANERAETFKQFQNQGGNIDVLVAQPAAMSHGLTLTAANTIVWFAPVCSNETYSQANARITRPGQKLTQFIVHIEGSPVERRIYQRLKDRQRLEGMLLELLKETNW